MNESHWLAEYFPLRKYRFEFVTRTGFVLPNPIGSSVRGAFGKALRHIACLTGESSCDGCVMHRQCGYATLFEARPPESYLYRKYQGVPNPYIVVPPATEACKLPANTTFDVSVVLIGPALNQLRLVILALKKAMQRGLVPSGGSADLLRVFPMEIDLLGHESSLDAIYTEACPRITNHCTTTPVLPAPERLNAIKLNFITPLILQRNGKLLNAQSLRAKDILMGLVRRQSSFVEMQMGDTMPVDFKALAAQSEQISLNAELEWKKSSRFSYSQKRKMPTSGYVGDIELHGSLASFWPMLFLGQYLNLGKKASFGNGMYKLVPIQKP